MNIKLIQSGGLAGKKMTAVAASKLNEADWSELIGVVKKKTGNKRSADAFSYVIQKEEDDNSKTIIDISNIPVKHEALFKKLFDKLKPEK
jgi:hypothetical protein